MQGKSINGYTLTKSLGIGGMAEVWLAENKLGKTAAVKLLLPKLCSDENIKTRFYTEAKVMVGLDHPFIRQVYDYGDIDGRPAIVMEYLDGEDMKGLMKRGQRFSDEELKKWWNQLVDALNYTHARGIVHRDLKPGNIFVDRQRNVKLLDFGIAKVKESIGATQTGQKLGTLMYMSPEQVRDSKSIDYHTDIYSLAVTFVHLITGKAPYDSDSSSDFEISEQIVYKPLDISGLPKFWADMLSPYLNKTPDQRPDLRPISDGNRAQPGSRMSSDDDDGTVVEGAPNRNVGRSPSDNLRTSTPTKRQPALANVQPKPAQKGNKKKNVWIVLLTLLVLAMGGVVAWLLIEKSTGGIEQFVEDYNNKVKSLDFQLENMVQDKKGNVANEIFILQGLDILKELEEMENDALFAKTDLVPRYTQKYAMFKEKLHAAELLLTQEINRQVQDDMADETNRYYVDAMNRMNLVKNLLRQANQGDAISIQKPQRQTQN